MAKITKYICDECGGDLPSPHIKLVFRDEDTNGFVHVKDNQITDVDRFPSGVHQFCDTKCLTNYIKKWKS